jgi:hypothetical protein
MLTAMGPRLSLMALHTSPLSLSINHKNTHPCLNCCLEENVEVEHFSDFKEF